MSDRLPPLRIAVVAQPAYAGLHISSLRHRLGFHHHFSTYQFGHRLRPNSHDLVVLVAEDEFHLQPQSVQVERIKAIAGTTPCRVATRRATHELTSTLASMLNIERWQFWPTKDDAVADVMTLLGLEQPTSPC